MIIELTTDQVKSLVMERRLDIEDNSQSGGVVTLELVDDPRCVHGKMCSTECELCMEEEQ